MNANGLSPYDLFSWNKYDIDFDICDSLIILIHIDKDHLRMLTLCMLGPLRHSWLFFPSSSCSMLLLPLSLQAVDCLSRSLSGRLGPPSFPLPGLTPFPSGPRQHPTLLSGTITLFWETVMKTSMHDWNHSKIFGTGMICSCTLRPCTLHPHTSSPHTICPCMFFPYVFTSPYVSSLKELQPTILHQPMDWLGI